MGNGAVRERLRELAEKATPGPWKSDIDVMAAEPPFYFSVLVVAGRPNTSMLFSSETEVLNEVTQESSQRAVASQDGRDAAYIAAADPDTIKALLDELDTLERRVRAAEGALERLATRHEWTPQLGLCICGEHVEARSLISGTKEPTDG